MTATLPIVDFVDEVRARVPLAGEPDIMVALRDAARVLCRRTQLWRENRNLVVTVPDGQVLWDDAASRIHMIETARIDGRSLSLRTPVWLDEHHPTWQDAGQEPAQARYITQMVSDKIIVWPAEQGTIRMRAILVPSRDCQTMPEFLMTDHMEVLGLGAAAKLLMLPNPDFANPQYAQALDKEFQDEVSRLAGQSARSQIKAPRRSRSDWF
jgi:hypothetical protein